jgi:hypothetical protein
MDVMQTSRRSAAAFGFALIGALEAGKRTSGSKRPYERRVDPGARSLVRRPVERDAFRLGVVAPRVGGEVAGPDEEQPDVPAKDALSRPAHRQEAVDHGFTGLDLDEAAVGADESYPCEPLRRS